MYAPEEPPARSIFTAARTQRLRAPVLWGVVFGAIQAAARLGFWWLDAATVYALSLTLIAAVSIGYREADGRRTVIAVEAAIAGVFVVVAAAAVTGPAGPRR
jgi:drug/metabolite transporter (DMT)-like permease